jgi:hypothetical protein
MWGTISRSPTRRATAEVCFSRSRAIGMRRSREQLVEKRWDRLPACRLFEECTGWKPTLLRMIRYLRWPLSCHDRHERRWAKNPTVNQVVSKRFCMQQQMQWSKRGAQSVAADPAQHTQPRTGFSIQALVPRHAGQRDARRGLIPSISMLSVTSVAPSTHVALYYSLENQGFSLLPPCHVVLCRRGEARLHGPLFFLTY